MIALAANRPRGTSVVGLESRLADDLACGEIWAAIADALNRLEHGVFLVDSFARIYFTSAAANQLLVSGRLRSFEGQLGAENAADTVKLRRLTAAVASTEGRCEPSDVDGLCRVGDPPLLLDAAASKQTVAHRATRLVILIATDPASIELPSPHRLRQVFGLTPAESRFASQIVTGEGLKEVATRIGVSESTARTHLHRIFEKTGTSRQAELVRLVLASRLSVRSLFCQ
jgi:DNA-binding CsgD family transcriptional regulator